MKEEEVLTLLNRLVLEEGSSELDVAVGKALSQLRSTAYCVDGQDDPETGCPMFSTPEYVKWSEYESDYFGKHDDLPPDDHYPEEFLTGKPPFGYCDMYSRSLDAILKHVPDDQTFNLNRPVNGKYVCTIGERTIMMADTAACAVAAALILHKQETGALVYD